jgi:hypothetical protein
LERCGRLNNRWRGSISSLPIIETVNSDITEYIATNVISITDGQIYTNRRLFNLGIRPAIDTTLSVSRIGSSAQSMKIRNITTWIRDEIRNEGLLDHQLVSLEVVLNQSYLWITSFETLIYVIWMYKYDILQLIDSTIIAELSIINIWNSIWNLIAIELLVTYYLMIFSLYIYDRIDRLNLILHPILITIIPLIYSLDCT